MAYDGNFAFQKFLQAVILLLLDSKIDLTNWKVKGEQSTLDWVTCQSDNFLLL